MAQRIRIKICCISSPEEAQLASDAGADLIGLVGPMPSGPGVLDLNQAATISRDHHGTAQPILLTSSPTADAIEADAAQVGVTHVQVVRHIAPAEAARLGKRSLTYFQVIHIEDERALELIDQYGAHCDAFLLDSGRPSQDALGGTGAVHDWRISAEFVRRANKPTFLAGGLSPENVAEAIRLVQPDGLDICSGIRRGGHLNAARLKAFIKAATHQP